MIAISSFRPLDDNKEVAANQILAIDSWRAVFHNIFLFGPFEWRLACPRTTFIEGPDFPPLSLLYLIASQSEEPAVILNADIVVGRHLVEAADKAFRMGAYALTSRRYEYDPANPDFASAKVVDLGADFFCAHNWVWRKAWLAVPPQLRIGHSMWDNWLMGFLTVNFKRAFVDISDFKAIFHPRHGSRKQPHSFELPNDKYIHSGAGFPAKLK